MRSKQFHQWNDAKLAKLAELKDSMTITQLRNTFHCSRSELRAAMEFLASSEFMIEWQGEVDGVKYIRYKPGRALGSVTTYGEVI